MRQQGEPLAEGAVADLIMVLKEGHERGRRQMPAAGSAGLSVVVCRALALIDEPFREAACQPLGRSVGEVGVIGLALAGQKDVEDVVEVVVPLSVERLRPEPAGVVPLVLQYEMDVTIGQGGPDLGWLMLGGGLLLAGAGAVAASRRRQPAAA